MNNRATNLARQLLPHATWRKSSRSGSGGGGGGSGCVEVALSNGLIGVRDSRNPTGTVLAFSSEAQWANLIHQIKYAKLDLG